MDRKIDCLILGVISKIPFIEVEVFDGRIDIFSNSRVCCYLSFGSEAKIMLVMRYKILYELKFDLGMSV